MNIIGIAGRAGAGKDTAADVLVKSFGFVKVAFADEIKRTIRRWWPLFTDEELWGPSEARNRPRPEYNGLSVRKAAQFIGTEVGRELDPNLWARIGVIETAKKLLGEDGNPNRPLYTAQGGLSYRCSNETGGARGVVISDTRFPNEVAAIRAAGGRIWKIERPIDNQSAPAVWRKHVSEAHADGIVPDVTILNDASLDMFRVAVDFVYQHPNDTFIAASHFKAFTATW